MRRAILTVAVAALFFVPEAHAGFLVGASVGQAGADIQEGNADFNEQDAGFSARIGYRFMKFVGVEASYVDFGNPQGEVAAGLDLESEASGYSLFAVGTIPITRFELFGKVGYFDWDVDGELSNGTKFSDGGGDISYGAGFGVHVLGNLHVRMEYEVFQTDLSDTDESELSMFTIGADWRF